MNLQLVMRDEEGTEFLVATDVQLTNLDQVAECFNLIARIDETRFDAKRAWEMRHRTTMSAPAPELRPVLTVISNES